MLPLEVSRPLRKLDSERGIDLVHDRHHCDRCLCHYRPLCRRLVSPGQERKVGPLRRIGLCQGEPTDVLGCQLFMLTFVYSLENPCTPLESSWVI